MALVNGGVFAENRQRKASDGWRRPLLKVLSLLKGLIHRGNTERCQACLALSGSPPFKTHLLQRRRGVGFGFFYFLQ